MKVKNLKSSCKFLLLWVVGILLSVQAFAQTMTVKGIVKDETGLGIIGASVLVKGTTTGAITDFDGNFTLQAKQGDIIVISYIGYQTQELPAEASMNVILKEDTEMLDEVVVIGYGVARKNDLTGSVTAIKPDEKNRGLVTNAQDLMQGKIAGVNVTSASGTPGAGANIRIRGGSSLNASNDPLIVIDGLAMDNSGVKGLSNPLSMVNPADIETFTVLKDASATAIYGSRGSNGVIIITTKKGNAAQKPKVSYNGNISFSKARNLLDVLSGQEYGEFVENYYGVGSDAWNLIRKQTDASGNPIMGENGHYLYNNTDWQDQIYQTAVSHDHNVTLTGGLKNMPYRLSFGYTNQEGVLKTSGFERYTLSVNLNPKFLNDHLTFNISAKGMVANTDYANTGAIGAAVRMDPTQNVYADDPTDPRYANFGGYFQWSKQNDYSGINDPTWPWIAERNAVGNPVSLLNMQDESAKSKSLVGNVEIDYKVHGLEDLRIHMNFGGDFSTGKQTLNVSPNSYGDNTYYGRYGYEEIDKYNLSYNAYIQYMKDFNDKHHFDIMGGYEWQHFHRETNNEYYGLYASTNVAVDDAGNPLAGTRYNYTYLNAATENYLVSFFGRANYSLLDRYLFTATVRYDGSSRFKDHWALFPSFALGWRIKEEAFLKDVTAISDLKLRLGYGQTGQQEGIGDYNYFASYNVNTVPSSYYPIIGDGVLYRPTAYNDELTWETTTTYNTGIDFGFWNNRISGSVDYYYRKTTDLLNTVSVAAGSNFRNQVQSNIGSLRNTGVELSLTFRPIQTNDWYWEITANATYNDNEITELISDDEGYYVATGGISSGTGNMCQAHAVGHPSHSYYVYQQVYDENGMPIEGVYVDRNGDGQINQDDRYFYKSPWAPWTAGLSSRLTYKNWDFGFSLRASIGNYVFNDTADNFANIAKRYDDSFGYMQNCLPNSVAMGWESYNNALSDYWVQNASFLKCDNITLGYSFDNLFKTASYNGISGRVYFTANNVFCITDYEGVDPEVFQGIDNNLYPRPISFLVGLNLNF